MKKLSIVTLLLSLGNVTFAKNYNNFYYWDFFGLNQDSNKSEIKKVYKRLSLKYHPDKSAENFIQYTLYGPYSKLIEKTQEILLSPFDRTPYAHRPSSSTPPHQPNEIKSMEEQVNAMKRVYGENSLQYKEAKNKLDNANQENDTWGNQRSKYKAWETWTELQINLKSKADLSDILLQIQIDFYELMKKQVQQKKINVNQIKDFYNAIVNHDPDLAKIVDGLINVAIGKSLSVSLQNILSQEENKLTFLTISIDNEKTIKKTIINAFFYSYLSKKLRDIIVDILIKLATDYKNKNNTQNATNLLQQANNIIQTEWGTVFPIDSKYNDEIKLLLGQLKFAKIPTNILEEVKSLLNQATNKLFPNEFNPFYLQAIEKLKPSLPITAPNILEIYLTWANRFKILKTFNFQAYVLYLALLDAGTFEADAKAEDFPLPGTFGDKKDKLQQALDAVHEEDRNKAKNTLIERKITDSKLKEANKLINEAKTKGVQEAVKDYLEAIKILRPFTPQTSAKIINTYILIIEKYKNANELDNAKKFVKIAQDQVQNLGLVTNPSQYAGFQVAQDNLNTKAQGVGVAPIPTPTKAPKTDLGKLNQMFIDLQNQLALLKALID